jgi:hypothetical protein
MAEETTKYPSLADVYRDLTLFFKIDNDDQLALSDFPKIAEGRWEYFRQNWDFIKEDVLTRLQNLPDSLGRTGAIVQYGLFTSLIDRQRSSPQNPLANPANMRKFKDLFDNIFIADLQITPPEQSIIDRDIQRVSQLQKDDFYQMRERARITHDKTADSLGLGDADYDALLDRVPGPSFLTFKFSDFVVLTSLLTLKNTITSLIPMSFVSNERPDPFLQIRTALNNPGIPMNTYTSGFIIPFPAGATLERVAAQYLGNADSWMEIAVANGLQFPFVDEVGERVMMSINGIGNVAILPLSESENFGVDDEVFVGSSAKPLSRRKILNIEKDVNNDQLLLTLDGAANLQTYTTTQRGFVFHYKRNTVNASKFIMIPTTDVVGFPINASEPWFIKNLSQDLKNMGVDLAISIDNDLIFDNSDDLQLTYGLANAAQAATLKMNVKARELLRNPNFGFEEIAGRFNNSEITDSLLLLFVETALAGDDRFNGIDGFSFSITQNAVFINASIKLAGSEASIPITFQIPKG